MPALCMTPGGLACCSMILQGAMTFTLATSQPQAGIPAQSEALAECYKYKPTDIGRGHGHRHVHGHGLGHVHRHLPRHANVIVDFNCTGLG